MIAISLDRQRERFALAILWINEQARYAPLFVSPKMPT